MSFKSAKGLFSLIRKCGIDTLEITGGEATLRSDIFALVSFAKNELGFRNICIISNGSGFSEYNFARVAKKAGLNEVLISLHGHTGSLHDTLVGRKGAFAGILDSISNIQEAGMSCRTNTVITKLNYEYASDISALINSLGVKMINYIFFSPLDDAAAINKEIWPTYSESAPFIKRMIDDFAHKFELISIKVIPFCFMQGYEKYITDLFQNIYDPYEWNFPARIRIRRGKIVHFLAYLYGMALFADVKRMFRGNCRSLSAESFVRLQAHRECVKNRSCQYCKYDRICPGVWKGYAKKFSLNELKAARGEKIEDVRYYMNDRFRDL